VRGRIAIDDLVVALEEESLGHRNAPSDESRPDELTSDELTSDEFAE